MNAKYFTVPVIMLLLSVFMARGQNNQPAITKVEFTTLTRGYQKQIFISPDSVVKIVDGRSDENKMSKRKLSDGEWDAFVKETSGLVLKEIPSLPSPTSRRAFDGARHSTIVIRTGDGKSYSHAFDDENPNEKLHGLMELIKKMDTGEPDR